MLKINDFKEEDKIKVTQIDLASKSFVDWVNNQCNGIGIFTYGDRYVEINNPEIIFDKEFSIIKSKNIGIENCNRLNSALLNKISYIKILKNNKDKDVINEQKEDVPDKYFEKLSERKSKAKENFEDNYDKGKNVRFGEGRLKCFGDKKEYNKPCQRCIDEKECIILINKKDSEERLRVSRKEEKKREKKLKYSKIFSMFSLNNIASFIQNNLENIFKVLFIDFIALSLLILIGKCVYWVIFDSNVIDTVFCVPIIFIIFKILNNIDKNIELPKGLKELLEQFNETKGK